MRKFILFSLFFMIIAQSATGAVKEKMRIAIMDLKGVSMSERTAITISNMLRTEFINIGSFLVVERAQMDSILKEQGLQQTGCTDQACVVQMGKLLSAKKILVGELSTLGKSIIMTIRIVDVEKGISEFGASEKADSEDNLDKAVYNIARKIASRIEGGKEQPAAQPTVKKYKTEGAIPSGYYLRGILPGWAQIYSGHQVKGIVFGSIFITSAIWTTVAILNYNKSKDDYDKLGYGLSQDKYNSAYDKYEKNSKIATYSIIGVSVIYVANWVDVLFFSKPEPGQSLGMVKYDNIYVNLNLNCCRIYDKPDVKTDISATMRF